MKKELNEKKHCGPFGFSGKVWCDDKADIYIGSCNQVTKLIAKQTHPATIKFKYKGNCCDYLYIVCWSNDVGRNGLLADIQGDNQVLSGSNDWKVFATGKDKDINDTPSLTEINTELKNACKKGWKPPFNKGPKNGQAPFTSENTGTLSANAKFIWHNSGNDYSGSSDIPFKGFNHDEFLIFRLPLKSLFEERCYKCKCKSCKCKCDCGGSCDGCNADAKVQDQKLVNRAKQKAQTDRPTSGTGICSTSPFEKLKCKTLLEKKAGISPCLYLHWGDSARDQIENHDTELLYITICNPYTDIEFKGFRITNIKLVPTPTAAHQARIVPDCFVNFDCLTPCSCKTREFVLITRDELNAYTGNKKIMVEYCWDEITLVEEVSVKEAYFSIDIIKDE